MINAMKANLFGVTVHPIMPQCIATGIQGNQMIALARTALNCTVDVGTITAAKRSMATSAKDPKASLYKHSFAYSLALSTHIDVQ